MYRILIQSWYSYIIIIIVAIKMRANNNCSIVAPTMQLQWVRVKSALLSNNSTAPWIQMAALSRRCCASVVSFPYRADGLLHLAEDQDWTCLLTWLQVWGVCPLLQCQPGGLLCWHPSVPAELFDCGHLFMIHALYCCLNQANLAQPAVHF